MESNSLVNPLYFWPQFFIGECFASLLRFHEFWLGALQGKEEAQGSTLGKDGARRCVSRRAGPFRSHN